MKNIYYIITFVCFGFNLFCQTPQANLNRTLHWRFGHKAGLDFNTVTGQVTPFNGSNGVVFEGNSSISDTLGNLLFYVNGDTIWNKNYQPMLNGTGMPSDKITVLNSVIIPRPGNPDQYYVFINECLNNNCTGGKLKYSLVDMTLDGGKGAVVSGQKNIILMLEAYTGSMAFTKHANGIDYWMSYLEPPTSYNYCMIKITNAGADTTNRVVSSFSGGGGVMSRFSPDGTMFANAGYQIFQFNNATGVLSNQIQMPTDSFANYSAFSLEFSPNNKFLYFGLYNGGVYHNLFQQFDLSIYNSTAIASSIYNFYDSPTYYSFRGLGHLQLGANGKIYVAKTGGGTDSLHVIHNPNGSGPACNFQYNALALGNPCNFSLSVFPDFYFNNISILSSIDENLNANTSFKVYPNPCDDFTTLYLSENLKNKVTVFGISGKLVFETETNQSLLKINAQDFEAGIYFITVQNEKGSLTQKLIINQ